MNYLRNEEVKKQPPELFCPQQFCKILGKTPVPESLFYQSCTSQPATLLKKRLAQVFQGEFCQTSKNTFFIEHLLYRTPPGDCFLRRRFPQKQNKKKTILKLSYLKKNLPFHDDLYHFVLLYFFTARLAAFALHNKRWQW